MSDSRGSTATPERGRSRADRRPTDRAGLFARVALFVRQVVAELRKVVWPTQRELITYTTVVMVFVAVIMAIVTLLDFGFGHAVLTIFGGSS